MSCSSPYSTWRASFRPHLDGVRKGWDDLEVILATGECCVLALEFDGSHFINDPDSDISLCCEQDTGVRGIEFSPPEQEPVKLLCNPNDFSSAEWIISTGKAGHGHYQIFFRMLRYSGMPDSPKISVRIEKVFIDSLMFDRSITYPGYEVNAQALVLGARTGLPASGVKLHGNYGGISLPDTNTDENGKGSFIFLASKAGEYDLTVTQAADSSDFRTQKLTVRSLASALPLGLYVFPLVPKAGQPVTFGVRVMAGTNPQPFRKVFWNCDGEPFAMEYSNDNGWTTTTHTFESARKVNIEAVVPNPIGSAKTSMEVTISD